MPTLGSFLLIFALLLTQLSHQHFLIRYSLSVPQSMCLCILDFLLNRPQVVKIGDNLSSSVTISTGTPQGCVLSPQEAQECELFSRFFRGKIDNLLSDLQCFTYNDRPSDERRCFTDCIDVFDRTTNTEIIAICSASKKTCVWILCLQISSLTASPVLCLPSHGSQMLPWTRD